MPSGPLRILWVSDSPLLGTGFGRVTREVTTRLARVPGLEVACLGWGYDGWPYDRARFPLAIYPSGGPTAGPENFQRVVAEFQPQVVITLGEIWMIEWLATHRARVRFKWIAYVPIDGGPFYPPWAAVLKDVDELVAMSHFGRRVLQAGLPSRRVPVIYHGVDPAVFRPLPEREQLKAHERLRGKFVIGCVARNQPRKNIPALVQAFAALSRRLDDIHLLLHMNPCDVGYDLVTLLQRYRLEGRADLSSPDFALNEPLADAQLNRLYNLGDVTALPSTGEGFGLPILESLAAGVPVVATNCSACRELLGGAVEADGATAASDAKTSGPAEPPPARGELVRVLTTLTAGMNLIEQAVIDVDDLAARLERLYRDRDRLARYAAAGRAFAESLSWDKLLPQWLTVLGGVSGVEASSLADTPETRR